MDDAREIEWRFDALDLRPVLRWLDGPDAWTVAHGVSVIATGNAVTRVDRYLETADWRFHRAGCSLRIRRVGRRRDAEATLGRLDAAAVDAPRWRSRRELSEPLEAAEVPALLGSPGPVGERVRAVVGGKPLLPLFEVRTRRRTFSLEAGGMPLGEIALDETAIHQPGGPPARLRRVAIDAPEGALQRLEPFVRELREACALQPAGLSTFQAGILSSDLRPWPPERFGASEIDADMAIGAVALAVLRRHFSAMLAKEPGTRLGDDIEELHDMRVATRRLRAALALFGDVLPETAVRGREDLGWIGQVLGAVRDLDVQIEQLDTWLDALEEADREALTMLRSLLHEQRESARAAMLEMLDSRRYEAFVSRYGRTLRARHLARSGPASRPARALAPDLIESRFRAVRKGGARIEPASPAGDYHRLRIRCKRLRYALEFLADLYPGATQPLIRRLVTVQDVLGLHQDADVAIERLRRLAASSGDDLDPGAIFAMGEVAERYRQTMIELRGEFPAAYARLSGKPWKALRKRLERERPSHTPGDAGGGNRLELAAGDLDGFVVADARTVAELDLFVAGTGTFAAEIADWARAAGHRVVGLVELLDEARVGTRRHGFEVIAADAGPAGGRIVLGFGGERRASWERLAAAGWTARALVHPHASIAADVRLDPGATIGPRAVVGVGSVIGANAIVSRGALVGHHVDVGAFSTLNPGANIGGNTTIGEDVIVGMGVTVVNARSIGSRSVVAAGAVVIRDVDPDTRVQGVPARAVSTDSA